jgi:hypothetical protein
MDFSYYSYRTISTGREFFVPAGTLIGVKLLGPPEGMAAKAHIGCCVF